MGDRTFITVQKHGVISLPAELWKRHGLGEAGAQIELIERVDGAIELRPHAPGPTDQSWFWTERWQRMERESDADVEANRVIAFNSLEDLFDDLDDNA